MIQVRKRTCNNHFRGSKVGIVAMVVGVLEEVEEVVFMIVEMMTELFL